MKNISFNKKDIDFATLFEKVIEECLVKYTKREYVFTILYEFEKEDDYNKVMDNLKKKVKL